MENIYATLLLHKASKPITEANIEKVLKAAGVESDKTQIEKLIAGLKEKDIDAIIASATTAPIVAANIAGKGTSVEAESKKEEKEEEEEEEPTGIGSLF